MSNTTADAKEARAILQRVQNVLRDEDLLFAAEALRAVFEVIDGFTSIQARVRELEGALEDLQKSEAAYRMAHDAHGDGHLISGRCWDLMRRAGDKARAVLSKPEGGA